MKSPRKPMDAKKGRKFAEKGEPKGQKWEKGGKGVVKRGDFTGILDQCISDTRTQPSGGGGEYSANGGGAGKGLPKKGGKKKRRKGYLFKGE